MSADRDNNNQRLPSLDEHNSTRRSSIPPAKSALLDPAEVACPVCQTEMRHADAAVLMINPPQRRVECPGCGHRGVKYL